MSIKNIWMDGWMKGGRDDDGNGSRCSDDDNSNDDERMKVSVGCRLPPSS